MTDVRPERAQPVQPVTDRPTVVEQETRPTASAGWRVFQLLAAVAGGFLFGVGLVGIFRVDFDAGFLEATAQVLGFALSPMTAVAAILLGGAVLVSALADQDRGSTAFLGLFTLLAGVVGLAVEGEIEQSVGVDRRAALLFVAVGAAVFLLSLVPWWSNRRRTVTRL